MINMMPPNYEDMNDSFSEFELELLSAFLSNFADGNFDEGLRAATLQLHSLEETNPQNLVILKNLIDRIISFDDITKTSIKDYFMTYKRLPSIDGKVDENSTANIRAFFTTVFDKLNLSKYEG
jgi:hypothetical protein